MKLPALSPFQGAGSNGSNAAQLQWQSGEQPTAPDTVTTVEGLLQRSPSWSQYLISFGHIWSGWLVGWWFQEKKLNVIKDHHDKNG